MRMFFWVMGRMGIAQVLTCGSGDIHLCVRPMYHGYPYTGFGCDFGVFVHGVNDLRHMVAELCGAGEVLSCRTDRTPMKGYREGRLVHVLWGLWYQDGGRKWEVEDRYFLLNGFRGAGPS